MKRLKSLVLTLIIGMALGLWFGFNMGQDRPIFSNPFEEEAFREKIKATGDTLIEKSGEALEKGGQALQNRSQDEQPLELPEYQPQR